MCEICNGTGGIIDNHGWYANFIPCPNDKCNEEARKRSSDALKYLMADLKQMKVSEST